MRLKRHNADLCQPLFDWAPFPSTKAAIRLHTPLDLRGTIPAFIHVSDGQVDDPTVLDWLSVKAGDRLSAEAGDRLSAEAGACCAMVQGYLPEQSFKNAQRLICAPMGEQASRRPSSQA